LVITPFGSQCLAYLEDYDDTDLDRDESPDGSLRQPVDHDALG
jgi:hypothetical protein